MIEEEANEIKNKFSTARRSMLEDTDSGQLDDIDVIPNEEMLLVCKIYIVDPEIKVSSILLLRNVLYSTFRHLVKKAT